MDSITQATLGAVVGEAFFGKEIGGRAAVAGAILGTVPDLDILINPLVDHVVELRNHRGFSHSLLFCLLAAPAAGWLIDRLHKTAGIGWRRWGLMAFLTFFTHIMIDLPTTYGTQVLSPFTNTPFALDFVFIIDPLFTAPLMTGLFISLFLRRSSGSRRYLNLAGLSFGILYLVWGFGIKPHVHSVFESSFKNQFGYYENIKTTPNGPSTFLWNGYIAKDDTVYHAVYSIFDSNKHLSFSAIPQNTHIIEPYLNDRAPKALLWFSRGYYTVTRDDDQLVFYDLRFGRDDFWLTGEGTFIWGNKIKFDEQGDAHTFEPSIPAFHARTQNLSRYWNRIWGNRI